MKPRRNTSLDILRILASFGVVVIHVCSNYIGMYGVETVQFFWADFFDSLSRFSIPLFAMISGTVFLNPERNETLKDIWLQRILRVLFIYFLWSYLYYVYQSLFIWHFDCFHQGIVRTLTGIAYATNHLWYLGMLVGLYALTPVLKTWLAKATKKEVEYFLLLFFVFVIMQTTVTNLLESSLVDKFAVTFAFFDISGYVGYYVLGFYFTHFEISNKMVKGIYMSIPIDIVVNIMVSVNMSEEKGFYSPGIYDSFGLFTFLEVSALFLAISRYKMHTNEKKAKVLSNISKDTFGVYLVHVMIINFVVNDNMPKAFSKSVFILPISLAVFLISLIISALLRRLPYIGKYIC